MENSESALRDVFCEAAEITDAAARSAFLDSACKGDSALRVRVEQLLAADSDAGGFLRDTPGASRLETARIGQRIGRYRVVQRLGQGGYGMVYQAEQEEPVRRQVALKIVKLGMDTGAVVARFELERQALALMEHPNIARVLDAGATERGQPFFVMELVRGVPITKYCQQHALAVRPRLELFIQVCQAVQHAHQKGIIHRDLKPSNILVAEQDGVPVPKVIDFGIAKATEGAGHEEVTRAHESLGTPAYMSPEQLTPGVRDIDTRSDIYGLGVILYELMVGQPPFDPKLLTQSGLEQMRRLIREVDPPRPSTAITSSLRRLPPGASTAVHERVAALRSDLDWIVMKCLEKDRARRYDTANALAMDLRRHLAHEPVAARPPSALYRLHKVLRRHRLAFLSMAAVMLALISGLIVSTQLAIRLRTTNAHLSASLHELQWRNADEVSRAGDRDQAIAWWCHFLRQNPRDAAAAARLLSLLSSYDFPVLLLPPLVHEAPLVTVDFSRTGARLATASGTTARLWDVQSGQVEITLAHPAPLTSCVLGGERDLRLLTVSEEPKARLWDLTLPSPSASARQSPASEHRLIKEINLGLVDERLIGRRVLLPHDRRLMAMNLESNVVAVLDAETGAWMAPPLRLPAEIHAMALSEDGRLLATGSSSGVQLWNVASNQALFAPLGWSGLPGGLRFSENGRWLACSSEGKIWVMSTVTGVREREFSSRNSVLVFVDNAETLIAARRSPTGLSPTVFNFRTGQDGGSPFGQPQFDWSRHSSLSPVLFFVKSTERVNLLAPATGRPRLEPFFHDGVIVESKLHPTGKLVATASQDRTVRLWSVEMGRTEPVTLPVGGEVYEAQWSPSGDKILSASLRDTGAELRLWHGQTGAPLKPPWASGDIVYSAQWSPDGSRFATASQDLTARLWSGETGEMLCPPLRHDGVVVECAFSPDGDLLATAAGDKTVRLWNGRTGKAIGAPWPHSHVPLRLRFDRTGRRLATASQDGTVRVWSVPDGKMVLGPLRHDGICWIAVFSPDDRWIVSASSDGTVRLWDAATGQLALPPFRHEGPVFWASFSPDGRAIATSTESGIVRIWDVATGQPRSERMRHPNRVWVVKWSPDGRFLATTCSDGMARVWDVTTGHLVAEPFTHEAGTEVRRVAFSPDGGRLLTASFDGTVKLWDLSILRPPLPVPDWLPELGEALGGRRIGVKDALDSVPGDTFQRVKQRIAQAPEDDYYTRWGKWMVEQRLARPLKPFQP